MPIRSLAVLLFLAAPSLLAGTLVHHADGPVILRREGDLLRIADARSGALLAGAPAATTQRVLVQGAAGAHDDTLTIDLGQPIVLAGGIDYDGGADGWDTLVLRGGSAREQRVVQQTPHDGVIDVDGLVIRYSNLEPITDTAPAASYTVVGTAGPDFVTISDGPGGTTTISASTFESVTFANKTNVVFDGQGGGDFVSFDNPNPATGLSSLIVTNVQTVAQQRAVRYPSLGVNATGFVSLQDQTNDVDRIEITTQNDTIVYIDADDLIVGGVSPALAGVRAVVSGHVGVNTINGNLVLEDTDAPEVIRSGAVLGGITLSAGGGTSNLVVNVDRQAAIAPAGSVYIQTFGDLVLGVGGPTFANDIRAATSVTATILGTLRLGGNSTIMSDAFGTNSGEKLIIFGPIVQTETGRIVASGTAGADVELLTGVGSHSFLGTVLAVESTSGYVWFISRGMTIASTSGVAAPLGFVEIGGHGLHLGTVVDVPDSPMELSDAELDRVFSPIVAVHALSGTLQVTQPITFTTGTELIVRAPEGINGAGGSLSAPVLSFEMPAFDPLSWIITPASVRIGTNAPVPYTAVGTLNARARVLSPLWAYPSAQSDTFAVTPSPTTTINVDGYLPVPPASPGDVLDFDLAGVVAPVLTATFTANGYQGSLTSANRQPVNFQNIERLVDAPVDLAIAKSDGVTTAAAGTAVTYAIVVSNPAPIAVVGATVTDAFPPELTGVTWTCTASAGSSCTSAGSGNLNNVVTLAAGGSVTYSATGTIAPSTAPGTLSNTASVTTPAGYVETNPANNSATDTTAVTVASDLLVQKTSAAGVVDRGQTFSYTITLRNAGPSDARDVTLTDVLPADTTFVSLAAPALYSCSAPLAGGTGTVTCTRAVLPPSAVADTFTLTVRVDPAVPSGSTIANTVTATTTTPDPTPANSATANVPVRANIPTLSTVMLGLLAAMLGLAALRMMR